MQRCSGDTFVDMTAKSPKPPEQKWLTDLQSSWKAMRETSSANEMMDFILRKKRERCGRDGVHTVGCDCLKGCKCKIHEPQNSEFKELTASSGFIFNGDGIDGIDSLKHRRK